VVCYNDDCSVYEMQGKTSTKRFNTDPYPWSMCVASDNTVMVGTNGKVTVYTTKGKVLRSTHDSRDHLVVTPYHITVCHITGHIAVCGLDQSKYGGKNKPHVTVFTSNHDFKYHYYGPSPSQFNDSNTSDFDPCDVVYDSQCHLLIADYNNKCIQQVSGKGQFLSILHTDELKPKDLTLLQDGLIFVGFVDQIVKVIKYGSKMHVCGHCMIFISHRLSLRDNNKNKNKTILIDHC